MSDGDKKPPVLFVDDEQELVKLYARYLSDRVRPIIAFDGKEALKKLQATDNEVKAGFFDREMPNKTGDQLLSDVRELGYDFPVAMVTGVDPEKDIVSQSFDQYIHKPTSRGELVETYNELQKLAKKPDQIRRTKALQNKREALKQDTVKSSVWDSEEMSKLLRSKAAPSLGIGGDWHSESMGDRERNEQSYANEAHLQVPLPLYVEEIADKDPQRVLAYYPGAPPAGEDRDRSVYRVFQRVESGSFGTLTAAGLQNAMQYTALGLFALNITPGDKVAIMARPRFEWLITDLAVQAAGAVPVIIDPQAGQQRLKERLTAVEELDAVIAGTTEQLDRMWDVADVRVGITMNESDYSHEMKQPLGHIYQQARHRADDSDYRKLIKQIDSDSPAGVLLDDSGDGVDQIVVQHRHLSANATQLVARIHSQDDAGAGQPSPALDADAELPAAADGGQPLADGGKIDTGGFDADLEMEGDGDPDPDRGHDSTGGTEDGSVGTDDDLVDAAQDEDPTYKQTYLTAYPPHLPGGRVINHHLPLFQETPVMFAHDTNRFFTVCEQAEPDMVVTPPGMASAVYENAIADAAEEAPLGTVSRSARALRSYNRLERGTASPVDRLFAAYAKRYIAPTTTSALEHWPDIWMVGPQQAEHSLFHFLDAAGSEPLQFYGTDQCGGIITTGVLGDIPSSDESIGYPLLSERLSLNDEQASGESAGTLNIGGRNTPDPNGQAGASDNLFDANGFVQSGLEVTWQEDDEVHLHHDPRRP